MSMEDILKNLQREYVASLPDKISDIRKHIDHGCATSLETEFHKLKGTGKTYGIPEISELAAAVEGICHNDPDHGLRAADTALSILRDIHSARAADTAFPLAKDPRFNSLRN